MHENVQPCSPDCCHTCPRPTVMVHEWRLCLAFSCWPSPGASPPLIYSPKWHDLGAARPLISYMILHAFQSPSGMAAYAPPIDYSTCPSACTMVMAAGL